jgi:hypothetical protein
MSLEYKDGVKPFFRMLAVIYLPTAGQNSGVLANIEEGSLGSILTFLAASLCHDAAKNGVLNIGRSIPSGLTGAVDTGLD